MSNIKIKSNDFSLTLARGFQILEIFSPEVKAVTTAEAAGRIGISRAAARRLLLTLLELGYVERKKSSFQLSDKILLIGKGLLAHNNKWVVATSEIINLSNRMNEPFSVAVLDGIQIRFVARDSTRRIHSKRLVVGDTLPAYCSAAGKVLLASLEINEVEELVDRHGPLIQRTEATITNLHDLLEELRKVRLQNFAVADSEMDKGTIGIAVPIFDDSGGVLAALAVGSHKIRRSIAELKRDFLPELINVADRISRQL